MEDTELSKSLFSRVLFVIYSLVNVRPGVLKEKFHYHMQMAGASVSRLMTQRSADCSLGYMILKGDITGSPYLWIIIAVP
jgi:hypothetical protein